MSAETEQETPFKKGAKGTRFRTVLLGSIITILIISACLNVYYYSLSQTLANNVKGTTLEVSREFGFSLNYAAATLDSQATQENIRRLITTLQYHMQTALGLLRALRTYLVPTYQSQLQIIENLLKNMSVVGYGGVSDTLWNLRLQGNDPVLIQAFQDLNDTAAQKITEIGFELREAFESRRRNHMVEEFHIIPSRVENAVNAANDLKGMLDEWIARYQQL